MKKQMFDSEYVAEALINLKEYVKNNSFEEGYEHIQALYDSLQNLFPITARRTSISTHYANAFSDENLKNIAFVLDVLNVFLFKHGAIERDTVANYFNGMFAVKLKVSGFTNSPEYPKEMLLMNISSIIYALAA